MKYLQTVAGMIFIITGMATEAVSQDTLHLESDELKMVVADNEPYGEIHTRRGYHGITELYPAGSSGKSFFVPVFCGLNLEFIFNGDSTSYDRGRFEPRESPMELERLSSHQVRLKQSGTKNWPLQSVITYELAGNRVEMTYEGTLLDEVRSRHGYIGLFFASYINNPGRKGINFIGKLRSEDDSAGRWIRHRAPGHGRAANHRPAGSSWDPPFDPGFSLTLVSGFSDLEYMHPFYYGRSGENVLIMMFDNRDENAEVRFAQSPDGGGPVNPAWDFIYFKKNVSGGEKFGFRAGMVIKKFEGREDVIRQYEKWSGNKVERQ